MLTASGTIAFLLVASTLVSLAIHVTLADRITARFRALKASRDNRVPRLERRLDALDRMLADVDARCRDLASAGADPREMEQIQRSLNAQDLRLCTLEEGMEQWSAGLRSAEAAPTGPPFSFSEAELADLKRIKGIGAVMERTLNEAGITTIEELANLDTDQIELLSTRLGGFADRIGRDRWIEQARALTGRDA